jgi:ABC-type transport system involved in multi-copper enzyme maturation permease subunit
MRSSIGRISALARLIILDGLRRHALIGLVLFALAGTTGGLLFFDFIPRDIGRATNDFLFSLTWLTGFIFLLFHGVQVMAWDTERGSLHTFLARPISRTEYGLALYGGLAVLLLALNIILGALGWGMLNFIRGSVDAASYFQHLSLPFFLLAAAGLFWIQMMILAVILLFSSAVRGSFPVLLLTLCYYFICTGLPVVRESFKQKGSAGSGQFVDSLCKWLTTIFPDFSWLDFKTLAASGDAIPLPAQLALPFIQATLYIVVVLWLACAIYKRRDLQ